ncbi:MAG TPA: UrcA family protein [Steroidobacteraceae bacterium]|nr:UrcA family protein [Steroidobacteraceae bacterium]HRX88503.1 UrcA family protein [Steroidobacteraceae bacterium]
MAQFSLRAAAGAALLTGLMFGSLEANAADGITLNDEGKRETVVRVDQFNLATRSGAESLYRQIRHAAERVCSAGADPVSLRFKSQVRSCERQAIASAVEQVDMPSLTALHQTQVERSTRS